MFWATVGCRVIGGLIVALGVTCVALNWYATGDLSFLRFVGLILAAGTAYLFVAHHVARGRAWAGICGIVIVCLTLLLAAAVTLATALFVPWMLHGSGEQALILFAVLAVEGVVDFALVGLIMQLWRSVRAIQRGRAEAGHGFAVLPVAVVPVEPGGEP